FAPGVGVVVVAVALPEAGLVDRRELDSAQPLGALPEVLARDDEAQRIAVLRMRDDEVRRRLRPGELRELAPVDALEARVELRPARDAVDVLHVRAARQLVELLPRELELLLHLAEDAERPSREVGVLGDRAGVQHRPLLRQVLPGRQPGRVEPRVAHLLLGFRPEHGIYSRGMDSARRDRAYVRVQGPDAVDYLNRMLSNDVPAS